MKDNKKAVTSTVGTPVFDEWRKMNFAQDIMPVADISFRPCALYGPFFIANAYSSPEFIKSTPFDDEEIGHWVGFVKPATGEESRRLWALPPANTAKHLWQLSLVPKDNMCKGFLGFPRCGDAVGTSLGMNLNNEAVRCSELTYLGELPSE